MIIKPFFWTFSVIELRSHAADKTHSKFIFDSSSGRHEFLDLCSSIGIFFVVLPLSEVLLLLLRRSVVDRLGVAEINC